MSDSILLEMKNISKRFPGVVALDNVSLRVRAGTVHSLMGENGAGKSTLMKCLFGIYSKDSGKIYLNGKEVAFSGPKDALENGVAMVHQELNQALKRNVMDNLWLGRYPTVWKIAVSEREMYKRTKEIFDKLSINVDPRTPMSRMSVAERQMTEIAKAVSYDSKVIVLDEPTSSLTEHEVDHLFKIIDMLKKKGCGIIYISHKMEEILKISDDITVMRDGTHVITAPASEFTMDRIIRLMVGREMSDRFPEKKNTVGGTALEIKGLTSRYSHVKNVDMTVKRGEIVGIAGLAGAGRTELLENIFGIASRKNGEIFLNRKPVKNKSPRDSIKNGFALLTEERRADGIFGILNIRENVTVASLRNYISFGIYLSDNKRKKDTDWAISSMRIKCPSQYTQIRTLSGGNQQKVILARWLLTDPEILMLDEPTRGIDVGSKYEIYQLINKLAEKGKSVIMVSGELPELIGVCDRIYVMSGGAVSGVVNAAETTQEEIMRLAAKNA